MVMGMACISALLGVMILGNAWVAQLAHWGDSDGEEMYSIFGHFGLATGER
jgi:hypothetical protein